MAIKDGVDLVGALPGLVDPLTIKSHDALCHRKELEKSRDVRARGAAFLGEGGDVRRDSARLGKRRVKAFGVRSDKGAVDKTTIGQVNQKATEQHRVHARRNCQREIGTLGRRRATDIDGDDARGTLLPRLHHPPIEHRVAPSGVRPHKHQEVRLVEILITARHRIRPEGPAVAGDGRRHAQLRIGVDIGGANEALHQLVGGVIIFGEQLAER
jgi:hypothetical protein